MDAGFWEGVRSSGFTLPQDLPLADLTAELTQMLGSTDPDVREGLACSVLGTWIRNGVYDDLLSGLGDGMVAGLGSGTESGPGSRMDESANGSVFRRVSSARMLRECLVRTRMHRLVPADKVLDWGDRLVGWFLTEEDLRPFVPGQGWAYAMAHGADAIAELGRSPHLAGPEVAMLLDVLAERALARTDAIHSGEAERLAAAVLELLRRDLVGEDVLEPWVERLAAAARPCPPEPRLDHLAPGHDARALLQALFVQLSLAPEPPRVRADLLLLLADALRATTAETLSTPHLGGNG